MCGNTPASAISFNFNDGTTQGWTNAMISTAAAGYYDLSFGPAQQTGHDGWGAGPNAVWSVPGVTSNTNGTQWTPASVGAYFLGELPFSNQIGTTVWTSWPAPSSGAQQTIMARSPAFTLNGSGALTYVGCGRSYGVPLTTLSALPAVGGTWGSDSGNPDNTKGSCAVGLLRDDGVFVISQDFTQTDWITYTFTAAQLAPYVNDGHTYTLNLVDFWSGQNSWCAMDDINIPGTIATPKSSQTITFNPIPDHFTGDSFNLTATASSGLTVSFSVSGPASLNGTLLTCTNTGAVTVTASQAGNTNYWAATPVAQSFTVNQASGGSISITDFGFETPALGAGQFQYSPTGGAWTYEGGAGGGTGLAKNGSGFGNPTAPQGTQVTFLQGSGAKVSQIVAGFSAGTTYTMTFAAALRSYFTPQQTWDVLIDGNVVASFAPPTTAVTFSDYTLTFTTTAGSHEVAFNTSNLHGGDNTVFIDNVRITYAGGPVVPPAPSSLVATAASSSQINLSWTDNATTETGFKIERKTGTGGTYAQIATVGANVTTYTNTGLTTSTAYYYQIRANNTAGDSAYCTAATATTLPDCTLPTPWLHQDIGSVGLPGDVCYTSPTFSVSGGGADIWDVADAFHFVYQPWTNDVEIVARVITEQNTDPWAKAGVMVRESLSANSSHVAMIVTPGNGTSFLRRLSTGGGSAENHSGDGVVAPYWVRLLRNGNTITGYRSSDGINWVQVGSETLAMSGTICVGLPVTAHNNAVLNTSTFDNVIVRVPPVPAPAAPSGLILTASSSSTVVLSWTDNANSETGFEVERKTGAGGTYVNVGSAGANVTSGTDSGLTADTLYYYRVRAVNASGSSAYCTEASVTAQSNGTGTGLQGEYFNNQNLSGTATITRTDATVGFNWGGASPDASLPADGFSVRWTGQVQPQYSQTYTFYTLSDDGVRLWANNVQLVDNWTAHSATENSGTIALTAGQKYDIRLEFFDSGADAVAQLSWSSTSTPKAIVPQSRLYLPPPPSAPTAPSALLATASSSSQINLTWTDNANNETGFKIERKTGSGGTYAQIATVGANVTSYSSLGLSPNTQYYYRVRATNSGGDSAFCTEASATTQPDVTGTGLYGEYFNNQNLSGTATLTRTDATVGFNWGGASPDASLPADGFSVRWTGQVQPQYSQTYTFYTLSDDGVRLWVNNVQLVDNWTGHSATENSGTIALTADQKYDIRLEFYDSGGDAVAQLSWSSTSTPKAIVPQSRLYLPLTPTVPAAPSALLATASSSSQINLTWTDNANNETGFKIERKTGSGGAYAQIATVGANVTSYSSLGLSASTQYYFRVRATNSGGDSAFCTEASATTLPADVAGPLGAYQVSAGGRSYTFSKHANLSIQFNSDQTISDNSQGLSFDGQNTWCNGRLRFYIIDHLFFEDANQVHQRLEGIFLPDGIHTVHAYDCDPSVIGSYAAFRSEKSGTWNPNFKDPAVKMWFVSFSAQSPVPQGYAVMPDWLKVSGKLEFPVGEQKDFGNKICAIAVNNQGDTPAQYQSLGLTTDCNWTQGGPQTFATLQAHGVPDDGFYNFGRGRAEYQGLSKKSVLTTQFAEDGRPGKDADFYRGSRDRYMEAGITNMMDIPNFGEYGLNEAGGSGEALKTETTFRESLTTKLFNWYAPGGEGWSGIKGYYAARMFEYQNDNNKEYFQCGVRKNFLSFIYQHEMTKLATKTYEGIDRERELIGYSMPYYEDLSGVVYNNTVINFPEGDLEVNEGYTGVDWNNMYRFVAISMFVGKGFTMWEVIQPLGLDSTKISIIEENHLNQMRWKRRGESNWQQYQPGVNGAPERSSSGIVSRFSANPVNAAYAAADAIRGVLDRSDLTIELIGYTSSLGNVQLQGGTSGYNLNGHGPLNRNNFDLWAVKNAGICLLGTGKNGTRVIVYCNESISAHRSETVTAMGVTFQAYGGQVCIIKL